MSRCRSSAVCGRSAAMLFVERLLSHSYQRAKCSHECCSKECKLEALGWWFFWWVGEHGCAGSVSNKRQVAWWKLVGSRQRDLWGELISRWKTSPSVVWSCELKRCIVLAFVSLLWTLRLACVMHNLWIECRSLFVLHIVYTLCSNVMMAVLLLRLSVWSSRTNMCIGSFANAISTRCSEGNNALLKDTECLPGVPPMSPVSDTVVHLKFK